MPSCEENFEAYTGFSEVLHFISADNAGAQDVRVLRVQSRCRRLGAPQFQVVLVGLLGLQLLRLAVCR